LKSFCIHLAFIKGVVSITVRYLIQQSCGYVFRMIIPEDLRPIIGKRELRYSLNECSLLNAKRKSKRISTKVKGLFSKIGIEARKGNIGTSQMDKAKINKLISDMIRVTIADMEHEKATGKPITRGQLDDYLNDLGLFEHDYRESLSLRDYKIVFPVVDFLIKEGKLGIQKDSPDYLQFAAEVLKAQIHLLQIDRMQSTGDYSYRYRPQPTEWDTEPEPESETIGEVVAEYWAEKSGNWKPRTIPDYKIFRNTLINFVDKKTMIHTVDYAAGREYRDGTE